MPVRRRAVRFAAYGALGLATEIVFTAAHEAFASKGRRIHAHTSAWMFPVYGLVQPLFEPAHDAMRRRLPAPARAAVYAAGFLGAEYVSGALYRRMLGAAPWDYSHARWNVDGLIRLDYAIFWAAAGVGLERVDDAMRGTCAGRGERGSIVAEPEGAPWERPSACRNARTRRARGIRS